MTRHAELFMLHAIQEWGQSESERLTAVQGVLNAAGLDATATCWPVFGHIWKSPCTGPDGEVATAWLQNLTDNLQQGEFYSEVAQIEQAIADRGRGEKEPQT
jgi:hypothetical protein